MTCRNRCCLFVYAPVNTFFLHFFAFTPVLRQRKGLCAQNFCRSNLQHRWVGAFAHACVRFCFVSVWLCFRVTSLRWSNPPANTFGPKLMNEEILLFFYQLNECWHWHVFNYCYILSACCVSVCVDQVLQSCLRLFQYFYQAFQDVWDFRFVFVCASAVLKCSDAFSCGMSQQLNS